MGENAAKIKRNKLMDQERIKQYEELFDFYKKSRLIAYCSPDQFQYRQNELLQKLAEFILLPFWQRQNNENEKKDI